MVAAWDHSALKRLRKASYITNTLDRNERMSFIQKQVGHTTTRMIVGHYYRHVPAPNDGDRLEDAWNSASILPVSEDAKSQVSELDENGGGCVDLAQNSLHPRLAW
jgi:hypothetical protein